MKDHPILFSGAMVRAILEGRKTQTRRVVKRAGKLAGYKLPDDLGGAVQSGSGVIKSNGVFYGPLHYPYGRPGDRLWVRETFCHKCDDNDRFVYKADGNLDPSCYWFRASDPDVCNVEDSEKSPWEPSIHMPRRASRITLEVVSIRVERLQDISEEDAIAEGIYKTTPLPGGESLYLSDPKGTKGPMVGGTAKEAYGLLWESINGYGSWAVNPWVWVIEFRRIEK